MSNNGTVTITPTDGYDAMSNVSLTVNVPQTGTTQDKDVGDVELYKNDIPYTLSVEPDDGYDAMTKVSAQIKYNLTLQNKSVTPTTSQQTITADSNYDGLGTATVEAATGGSGYQSLTGFELLDGETETFDGVTVSTVDPNVTAERAIMAVPKQSEHGIYFIKHIGGYNTRIRYAIGSDYQIAYGDKKFFMSSYTGNNLSATQVITATETTNYYLLPSKTAIVAWTKGEKYVMWFIPESDLKVPASMLALMQKYEEEPQDDFYEEPVPASSDEINPSDEATTSEEDDE